MERIRCLPLGECASFFAVCGAQLRPTEGIRSAVATDLKNFVRSSDSRKRTRFGVEGAEQIETFARPRRTDASASRRPVARADCV